MSQITVGEDITAILIAGGLIAAFVLVLADSFSEYRGWREYKRDTRLILQISDFFRDGAVSGGGGGTDVGVISRDELMENLPPFASRLRRQGLEVCVEVISLDRRPLFRGSRRGGDLTESISVPVVYLSENEEIPARMIVRLGGR